MKKWLIFAASLVGVVALCALIWLVFPLIAIAGAEPFASVWLRLALVLLVITIFAAVYAWKYYKGRKASAALAAEIARPAADSSDAKQLAGKMADALKTLKTSSKAKGDFLYELPWYLIIGPPGAGKTTALINSGLKFALTDGRERRPVAGVGGTRYCDWWFTEDAVLIDTAGRYTTQDSDADADKKSWLSFLDLLKKHRPLQPVNGVMVAISLADLMTLPEAELSAHCAAIRRRLDELHERLGVDFPVYVMFTKADLVAGFNEYFASLGEQRRRMVWGATFRVNDKSENKVGDAPGEFDLLMDRLNQEMPDKLQEEGDPLNRARIFGFPSQMAALKPAVIGFLNQIFEPTRYQTDIPLRGFYFTSGTQEGTPIDRILGAMTGAFQTGAAQPAMSGRGKSYFLGDLLTKVIFGESGWVSTNRAAQKRSAVLAYGGYAAVGIVSLALVLLWGLSYFYNTELIAAASSGITRYTEIAKPVLAEEVVADTDFVKPMGLLQILANLPAGYATRDQAEDPIGTMGLSQKQTLLAAATAAYHQALDRTLRSRLLLYVEKQIEANQENQAFLYEALKVYLMLGRYDSAPIDKDLILAWMGNEWNATEVPNPKAREEFLAHVAAMLDLDNEGGVIVPLNGELVEQSQRVIARMGLAERAYLLLKSNAANEPGDDWSVAAAGGPEVKTVFEAASGGDLEAITVPKFYTYSGFHELFLGKMSDIADRLDEERWVLGPLGSQTAVAGQVQTLGPNLLKLYSADFVKAWNSALGQLRLRPLAADKQNYAILDALTGPTSPLDMLLKSVSAETRLTAEPPQLPDKAGDGGALDPALELLKKKAESKLKGMAKLGLQIAQKSALQAGKPPRSQIPGADIEDQFQAFHEMVDGGPGQRPIDQLLDNLRGIRQNLLEAKADSESAASSAQVVAKFVLTLKTQNANRLPPPFDTMVQGAAQEFEGDAANATISELTAGLQSQVTQKCEQITANRFPFALSSKREVPWQDFAELFGEGGVLDGFFTTKLASLVDQTGKDWKWKDTTRLGRELSPATLKSFESASRIREAFFPLGGNYPNVTITVTPGNFSEQATGAIFELNGTKLETVTTVGDSKDFTWPGASADGSASVTILPEVDNGKSTIAIKGPWALYKLIAVGGAKKRGDAMNVTYAIGGRFVSYQIKVGSISNPFALPELQGFKCPKSF